METAPNKRVRRSPAFNALSPNFIVLKQQRGEQVKREEQECVLLTRM